MLVTYRPPSGAPVVAGTRASSGVRMRQARIALIGLAAALVAASPSFADPGSVSYLFNRKGVVIVPKGKLSEDDVLGAVLDAGAEEVNDLGDSYEGVSEATDMVAVRTALQQAGIDYDSAEANFLPTMQVDLDEEGARKIFKLIDALEDSDDVQNVFANFDVSDEVMEKVDA